MAQYTAYANYVIYFSVQADYDAAVAIAGGQGIQMSPVSAAALFGLAYPPTFPGPPNGIYGNAPLSIFNIAHPLPSGIDLLDTVDSVLVPGQAGNPASVFPAGPDMLLVWFGIIQKNAEQTETPGVQWFIPRRRWISGFEFPPDFEGGSTINSDCACRDASRTIDGVGLAYRGNNNTNPQNRTVNQYISGFTTKDSWERFYIRIRQYPTADFGVWRSHGNGGAAGGGIKISPTGVLIAFELSSVGAEIQSVSTSNPLQLNVWYKIDLVVVYGDGVDQSGSLNVLINWDGLNVFDNAFVGGTIPSGLGGNLNHTDSDLGKWTSGVDATVEIDLDDWHNADLPVNFPGGVKGLFSIDAVNGTHIKAVYSEIFIQTNWTPLLSGEVMNQAHNPSQTINASILSSTTSGAALEGETNVVDEPDNVGINVGAFCSIIGIRSRNTGGTDGQLGYRIAGGAAVMASINELTSENNRQVMYRGEIGLEVPISIVPYSVRHTKSADGNTGVVIALQSIVQYIGLWGSEDNPDFFDPPRLGFTHNSRYANSMWGFLGPIPDAPVSAVGGTYVGTGANTTIVLPWPCHFLFIRRVGSAQTSVMWVGSGMGGHTITAGNRVIPQDIVRVFTDPSTGVSQAKIAGTNAELNALGITYQYTAFCDPGMRFNLCTSFLHASGSGPASNPLIDDVFTPEFGFALDEIVGLPGNADGISSKGPGHGANDGTTLGGNAIANWGTFATGLFTSRSGLHFNNNTQVALSLWRTTDIFCGNIMVQITSYTGNGTNPRTITLTPTSGRFPLLVIVMPASGANVAFYRDPSHTGSDSSNIVTGTISTVAITGGAMDSITVNSALNANGIVYNVFVIPGSAASWANGHFFPPNCEPDNTPWPVPPVVPSDIIIIGQGGLILNGQVPLTLLKDLSGIYTLVPGKKTDTLYDRQTGVTSVEMAIPNPHFKTGYLGG